MHWKRWLPFSLFFLFVAGIIIGSGLGQISSITNWVNDVPFGDKSGHLLLIGTLTFLLNYGVNGRIVKIGRLKILLGCAIVAVAITVEEFSQISIPARTFDWLDLCANYLGIALAGIVWFHTHPC